jgi:hypothetical protein
VARGVGTLIPDGADMMYVVDVINTELIEA